MFWITFSELEGILVAELHGELDMIAAAEATEILMRAVAPYSRLIVELEELEFCDCAGLAALMRVRKRCDRRGGWLTLRNPQGIVLRLLTLMQMDAYFVIWDTT